MVCPSPLGSASSTVPDCQRRQSHPQTPQPQTPVSEAPASLSQSVNSALVQRMSIYIADTHALHLFFHHHLDVGPLRLTLIAYAFNYRIAVLRDGVKLAVRVGHSRRAARQILENVDIPLSQQVSVMFQIVSRGDI